MLLTPKIGEDSQYDQHFFSHGLKPPTRVYQCLLLFFSQWGKSLESQKIRKISSALAATLLEKKTRSLALLTKYTDFV